MSAPHLALLGQKQLVHKREALVVTVGDCARIEHVPEHAREKETVHRWQNLGDALLQKKRIS